MVFLLTLTMIFLGSCQTNKGKEGDPTDLVETGADLSKIPDVTDVPKGETTMDLGEMPEIPIVEGSMNITSADLLSLIRQGKLKAEDDYLVDMIVLKEGYDIITVSEKGYGKRSEQSEYRLQNRRGKGVKAGVFNGKTGRLVNLKQVNEDQDIMMIADNGIIMRTPAKDISKIGRDTIGVKVMRLKDDAKVMCVAIADHIAEDMTDDGDLHDDIRIEETITEE